MTSTPEAPPAWALQLIASVNRMEQTLRTKIDTPQAQYSTAKAAVYLGVGEKTVKNLLARGVFSDNRNADEQRRRCARTIQGDELDAYKEGREDAVARLRNELGRT